MSIHVEDVRSLSVTERLELIEEIWNSICDSNLDVPLTEAQRAELDRRKQAHELNPEAAREWSDVRTDLLDRFKC